MTSNLTQADLHDALHAQTVELSALMTDIMSQTDQRFDTLETQLTLHTKDIQWLVQHIDSIEKQLEIDDDERLVMAHQLSRLHTWTEQAAKRIGVKLAT